MKFLVLFLVSIKSELAEIEDSIFSGNIELSSNENSEIEAIFKDEIIRFRGRQKSEEKKKKRQMTKKAKHMLKMLKFAEPNMKSKHWLEYGCHCFADIKTDILTPGHGRTIDKIDSACRSLIECLTCSTEDHGESKKCNPYVGYSYESFVNPDTDEKEIQCMDNNNSCKRSMCECDATFIKTIQKHNYEAQHSKSKFDKIKQCPKSNNRNDNEEKDIMSFFSARNSQNEPGEKVCCGPRGARHHITVTRTRDCCETKSYNPFVSECCADGQVEPLGSC